MICGERDYFWPPEMFAETADRMPNWRFVSYQGVGHGVTITRRFFRDVTEFLAE